MRASTVVIVLMLGLASPATGQQPNAGQIGIYADSAATLTCADVPPGGYTRLRVVATRGDSYRRDISGVEFRIEITRPEGWTLHYVPPAGTIFIGDPIDVQPGENDDSGANVAFPACQAWDVNGNVDLGTLFVINQGGGPTELLVQSRSKPLNRDYPCPLFVDCLGYWLMCNTPRLAASCTERVPPPAPSFGECEPPPYFVFALNREPDPEWTAPPQPRPSRFGHGVLAMLTRRTLIELPEGTAEARLEDAIVRSEALRAALARNNVEWLTKGMPCFDLADTVLVNRTGETVRMTDWSKLWVFTVPTEANAAALIRDLAALRREVLFAETGGGGTVPNTIEPSETSFSAPNPIVQHGNLKLSLARSMPVRIEIYDAAGRRTRVLLNREVNAGPSDVFWDGTNDSGRAVPSGIYFVHAEIGERRSTQKLVFVR